MKKYISFIIILYFLFSIPYKAYGAPANKDAVNLNCKSAILMEYSTGKVVYEHNSHERLTPASVTKIMTALLVMEAVDSGQIKLTDKVVCSARVKSMGGSTMYLETGEIRTVEELLKGVMIESANDAAVALAEFMGGSEEGFVQKMNARAAELSMNDTHFETCTGLYPDNHYTSSYDIAIMSRALLSHKKILNYTSTWTETISEGRKSPFTLVNRNKLVKGYSGCDGLKTGYIKESLYCMSATAQRNGVRFISVIMGAQTYKERNYQASKLLDLGFSKYESINVVKKGENVGEINLQKAIPEKITVKASDDLNVILEKGKKIKFDKKIVIFKDLKLPMKKGTRVGSIMAVDGSNIYGQIPVILDVDVRKMKYSDVLGKSFKMWLNVK